MKEKTEINNFYFNNANRIKHKNPSTALTTLPDGKFT